LTKEYRACKYTLNRRRPVASGEPEEWESREQNGKEEVRRVEALLKEILAELKKINEYIDIQL